MLPKASSGGVFDSGRDAGVSGDKGACGSVGFLLDCEDRLATGTEICKLLLCLLLLLLLDDDRSLAGGGADGPLSAFTVVVGSCCCCFCGCCDGCALTEGDFWESIAVDFCDVDGLGVWPAADADLLLEFGEVMEDREVDVIGGDVLIVTPIFPLSFNTSAFLFVPVGVSRRGWSSLLLVDVESRLESRCAFTLATNACFSDVETGIQLTEC